MVEDGKFLLHKVFLKKGLTYLTVRSSFHLIILGSVCLEMIISSNFPSVFYTLIVGKKKGIWGRQLIQYLSNSTHLNWTSLSWTEGIRYAKCSSVNELALKRNFCCLHEGKQNLTILLAIDTNSGFFFFPFTCRSMAGRWFSITTWTTHYLN